MQLLHHYVDTFNRQAGSRVDGFTPQALRRLKDYDWREMFGSCAA